MSLSPDGRSLVFAANSGGDGALWLRPLDSQVAHRLAGSEGGTAPFWSPDSKSLAFFADGKLKRLDLSGGAPVVLCDARVGLLIGSGAWSPNGVVLLSANDGLYRVPSSGGEKSRVIHVDSARKESLTGYPGFLPDGKHFLYLVRSSDPHIQGVYAASLDRPESRVRVFAAESPAIYAPAVDGYPGYLVWLRGNDLVAQRFDPTRFTLGGDPTPIAHDVFRALIRGAFSISHSGVLAFMQTNLTALAWMSRDGKFLEEEVPKTSIDFFRLERDGKTVVFGSKGAVWMRDTSRQTTTRLTLNGESVEGGMLSPDRRQVVFKSAVNGEFYLRNAGENEPARQLTNIPDTRYLQDWSPDGQYVLYDQVDESTASDQWVMPLSGERKPFAVVRTPFADSGGRFSPDGKWIAYASNGSGRFEIYVQAFPVAGERWQVSNQGGNRPLWRGDGKEIYFIGPGNRLMAAPVRLVEKGIETGAPEPLFTLKQGGDTPYAVTADGRRFLVRMPDQGSRPINVVLNWQAGLK